MTVSKWVIAGTALLAAFTGVAILDTAMAQTVPEGQSCGGLLCDMGVFGHTSAPEPARATPPAAAPTVAAVHQAKPVAKLAKVAAKPSKPALGKPVVDGPAADRMKRPAELAKAASNTAAPSEVRPAAPPATAASEVFVPMTPYASQNPTARVQLQAIAPLQ